MALLTCPLVSLAMEIVSPFDGLISEKPHVWPRQRVNRRGCASISEVDESAALSRSANVNGVPQLVAVMPQQYLMPQNGMQQLVTLGQPPGMPPGMGSVPMPPQPPYGHAGWQDATNAPAQASAPPPPQHQGGRGHKGGGGQPSAQRRETGEVDYSLEIYVIDTPRHSPAR